MFRPQLRQGSEIWSIQIRNYICFPNIDTFSQIPLNFKSVHNNLTSIWFECVNFFQMVTMKLRQPYTTASIWSSGKITCTGANSEDQVYHAGHWVYTLYVRWIPKILIGSSRTPKISPWTIDHLRLYIHKKELMSGTFVTSIDPFHMCKRENRLFNITVITSKSRSMTEW